MQKQKQRLTILHLYPTRNLKVHPSHNGILRSHIVDKAGWIPPNLSVPKAWCWNMVVYFEWHWVLVNEPWPPYYLPNYFRPYSIMYHMSGAPFTVTMGVKVRDPRWFRAGPLRQLDHSRPRVRLSKFFVWHRSTGFSFQWVTWWVWKTMRPKKG